MQIRRLLLAQYCYIKRTSISDELEMAIAYGFQK